MDRGAYPDDMARFLRLNDEDVERILRGLPPEGGEDLRDLADFLADATVTLSRSPAREVRAAHMSLLAGEIRTASAGPEVSSGPAAAAQPSIQQTERKRRMRSPVARWAAKVTLAAAMLVALTAALAWAGVDLPGAAAETAFQKVLGVELPNQVQDAPDPAQLPDEASDTAVSVLTAIHDWRSGVGGSGCVFGATVSAAARGLQGEPDTSHCDHAGGNGAAGDHGNGAENASHASAGLKTAREASNGAAAEGQAHAGGGLGTAEDVSGGDHAVDGPTAADLASGDRSGAPATPGSR